MQKFSIIPRGKCETDVTLSTSAKQVLKVIRHGQTVMNVQNLELYALKIGIYFLNS